MLELLTNPPIALTFQSFTDIDFWTSVGILAGIYTIFTLGLQLNVGFTGIFNFGQAAFMAIGAYSMAILVTEAHMSFWLSLPISILIAIAFGLIVGLPSLRLRTDYFAIATIAAAEAIRLFALNARELTGGAQGTFGFGDDWDSVSETIEGWIADIGWTDVPTLFPLFLVVWAVALVLMLVMSRVQETPWGRVLRAIREDEDAARALGKNAFAYKLQSLAIAATLGAISGFFLALNLKFVVPEEFLPIVTFIGYACLILGGMASYWGVAVGAVILWSVLEGLRFLELPLSETRIAALRFLILGLVLIGLMAFRPQGIFGKREEMVLGD
ncbi:MAG TPA: branched-chain amino acid ABC transporter permease [Solirubrobacterales bacterium]|jgi:branched-chain amino acid transport system permease protein|nr:branched-chain amino acid ABC transporter permease [Solirubrobacterales bacterium]